MIILVLNSGSSSVKYKIFDIETHHVLAHGLVEKIGDDKGSITHIKVREDGSRLKIKKNEWYDHKKAIKKIVELLIDPESGVIKNKRDIIAVGHRIVHGGEHYNSPALVDENVLDALRKNIPLAPLHNPHNIKGIEVSSTIFPHAYQAVVFDTAFHQSIPKKTFLYGIPYELYEKNGIRSYGFHGTSHSYVAQKAARYLRKPFEKLSLITIHLGNGASIDAVKNGKCIDTSMGMTPLAGLLMGTRCGDIDPAVIFYLSRHLGMSLNRIENMLNQESGLKGICGTNDMRDVLERREAGDSMAGLSFDMYTYRVKKYIGAYYAALGGVDAIVFTAGIGENSYQVRESSCKGLEALGIMIDCKKNKLDKKGVRKISPENGRVEVLVVPTDEELMIAMETRKLVDNACTR